MMLTANPRAVRAPYPAEFRRLLSIERARESLVWLATWKAITVGATPIISLPDLANRLKVAKLDLKDESVRSRLGSFKALGAPIALARLVGRLHSDQRIEPAGLFAGRHRGLIKGLTVISATDGNHGRALAAAAHAMGCRCVIVLHAHVGAERERAIADYDAEIVRVTGNYDDSVVEASRLAKLHGWYVVSDTSYDGYEEIPCDVMQGYGAIAAEVMQQTDSRPNEPAQYTHVFLQGGVGGLAAAISSYCWEFHGAARPHFIVVEPEQADCLQQSALLGHAADATGSVDSVMAGLACGETSPLAWRFLEPSIDHFLTITDAAAVAAMKTLATGGENDVPVVSGESGAAGVAGLMVLRQDESWSMAAGLDGGSRILCINTEGATAPGVYSTLVGETAKSVLERQAAWVTAHA